MKHKPVLILGAIVLFTLTSFNNSKTKISTRIDKLSDKVEEKMIEWRHHLHQHPELSNREFKTAEYVSAHLKSLGLEVQTGIAHTGVVGIWE
jgi:amidohydrolase